MIFKPNKDQHLYYTQTQCNLKNLLVPCRKQKQVISVSAILYQLTWLMSC